MIKPLLYTYLAMVAVVLVMDFRHLKQAAPVNRWLSYGIVGIATGIWFYVTTLNKTVFLTVWMSHVIQRLLPLP